MMRKQLLAGTAFAAIAMMGTVAFAADMPAPAPVAPPPMAPAPVPIFYDWTGFYVGAHAGFNWEKKRIHHPGFDVEFPELDDWFLLNDPVRLTLDADGFHGGFQIGGNWQFDQFVFGLEGDFSWTNADGSRTVPFHFEAWEDGDPFPTDEDDFPFTYNQKIKWFGTARARIGWAIDNILIYGTGGFAWKRSELTLSGFVEQDPFVDPLFTFSKDAKTHTGWAIGAGAEIGLTENISLKGEWLYMDLGRKTYNLHLNMPDGDGGSFLVHAPTRVKLTEHVVRVGLNWRFVTAPAAVAPAAPAPVKW